MPGTRHRGFVVDSSMKLIIRLVIMHAEELLKMMRVDLKCKYTHHQVALNLTF